MFLQHELMETAVNEAPRTSGRYAAFLYRDHGCWVVVFLLAESEQDVFIVMSDVHEQGIDEHDHTCHFEPFLDRREHGILKIALSV